MFLGHKHAHKMCCLHPVLPADLLVVLFFSQSLSLLCMQAWLIFFFPLHFFFHFLYYTDVGSVTFVIAAYLVSSASAILFPDSRLLQAEAEQHN